MNFSILGFTLRMLQRGEVLLLLATALALFLANSAMAPLYFASLNWHGPQHLPLPLSPQHFINDGLMAVFFLATVGTAFLIRVWKLRSVRSIPGVGAVHDAGLDAVRDRIRKETEY